MMQVTHSRVASGYPLHSEHAALVHRCEWAREHRQERAVVLVLSQARAYDGAQVDTGQGAQELERYALARA